MKYVHGLVAALALGAGTPVLAAQSAFTQLCWGTNGVADEMFDSCASTQDGGTGTTESIVDQALPNPDGGLQHFAGRAKASATPDTWRVETSLDLQAYRRDNYVWSTKPQGGLEAATTAVASAMSTDSVTIDGGTGVYTLNFILAVDGQLWSNSPLLSSSFCASVFMNSGVPAATSFCTGVNEGVPATVVLSYADLPFGAPITPTLSISAYQFISPLVADEVPGLGGELFDAQGGVAFGSTVRLDALLVTDANGNPIPGLTMSSASGFSYPLSPLNSAPLPVPEPASALLLLAGLAGLGLRRRLVAPRG